MRLGEVKNIIKKALDTDNEIFIDYETIFSGQGYLIKNYRNLFDTLTLLMNEAWNEFDSAPISDIFLKHPKGCLLYTSPSPRD